MYNLFIIFYFILSCHATSNCFDLVTTPTLTFYQDAMTIGSRSAPIKQLTCSGGNGCQFSSEISTIQCQNTGTDDYGNVQWKCSAQLPNQVQLGKITVSCEGCQNALDLTKLSGSCGLFFELIKVSNIRSDNDDSNIDASYRLTAVIIILIFSCVIISLMFYVDYNTNNVSRTPRSSNDYVNITNAEPIASYQNNIPSTSYQNNIPSAPYQNNIPSAPSQFMFNPQYIQPQSNNNAFVNGMMAESLISNGRHHHNNGITTGIMLGSMSSGNNNGFINGMIAESILGSNNNGHNNKHHNKHHSTQTHKSSGFGSTVTR